MASSWPDGRWRPLLAIVAMLMFGVGVYLTAMLYADVAPFKQLYNVATADQDAAVTPRIAGAAIVLPLSIAGLLLLWRARPGADSRRVIRLVAIVFLISGLHSCSITARLPYGFGSSYEHASKEQHRHLDISRSAGNVLLLAGLIGLVWSAAIPRNGRARAHEDPPIIS